MAHSDSKIDNFNRALDEAIAEYYRKTEAGATLDPSAFVAKYPKLVDQLRDFLSNVLKFDKELHLAQPHFISPPAARVSDALTQDFSAGTSAEWSLGRLKGQEFPIDFGSYVLLSEIDRGGMGIVFKAQDKTLPRIVALKVIRAGEFASVSEIQRFRVEADAIATVKHPNIVPIFEFGEERGLIFSRWNM